AGGSDVPGRDAERPLAEGGRRPVGPQSPGPGRPLPGGARHRQTAARPHRSGHARTRRGRGALPRLDMAVSATVRTPVMLVVLDGFGLAPAGPGNAVAAARTPTFDAIWEAGPRTTLEASGKAVGLPAGQLGNSEVGHRNIGAGRRVMQSLTYVDELIETGEFYQNSVLRETITAASASTLHLMGLVSDGGVHSDLQHLLALLEAAARRPPRRVRVHVFTDGRDSAPDGGRSYVEAVESRLQVLREQGLDARIATVVGRYFAMDRDRRWERTGQAH